MTNRLHVERDRLLRLAAASGSVVAVDVEPNLRLYHVRLRVPAPVGTGTDYRVERDHTLTLTLPDTFPVRPPIPRLDHPILAPNIWPTGVPCIVEHNWFPAQRLDQVVCDVIEEMQGLTPNFGSVANVEAGRLYQQAAFLAELRRRLGPPIRLSPPPDLPAGSGVRTVGHGPTQPTGGIRTVGGAGLLPTGGIRTRGAPPPRPGGSRALH